MPPSPKIRTIFMGTPDFAVPPLEALAASDRIEILAVITQPDRPAGRKMAMKEPPVKTAASKLGIPVFQPTSLSLFADSEAGQKLFSSDIDLIAVAAYAQILPKKILELPRLGCLNVHASLLPKYRGAAVIQAPILNGDKKTGITIIRMDENLDTGPILSQNIFELDGTETAGFLTDKLSILGGDLLVKTVINFADSRVKETAQDGSAASYVRTIKKPDGRIDWQKPAAQIERQVRAMHPWPSAHTEYTDQEGKIHNLKILSVLKDFVDAPDLQPGQTFEQAGRLAVKCADKALVMQNIQPAGKKSMDSAEFLRGNQKIIGNVLH